VEELEGEPNKHIQLDEVLKLWEDHFKKHLNTSYPHDGNAIHSIEQIYIFIYKSG